MERRWVGWRVLPFLAASTVCALLFCMSPAWAAVLVVDEETCTLVDALQAANSDEQVGGCAGGDGADEIHLVVDVALTAAYHDFLPDGFLVAPLPGCDEPNVIDRNGLPVVDTDVSILGVGESYRRVARSSGAPAFRIFDVGPGGSLRLQNVSVEKGEVSEDAGIRVRPGAELDVVESRFFGNVAVGSDCSHGGGGTLGVGLGAHASLRKVVAESTGGISSSGVVEISRSRFVRGFINNSGEMQVVDSSLVEGTSLLNHGRLVLDNVVLRDETNQASVGLTNQGWASVRSSVVSGFRTSALLNQHRDHLESVLHVIDSVVHDNGFPRGSRRRFPLGPAIQNIRSRVVVENSRFFRNNATAGGAVYSFAGRVVFLDSTIEDNEARGEGGGVAVVEGADLIVRRSTFSGNRAERGGAISMRAPQTPGGRLGGRAAILNSTLSGNSAVEGGALWHWAEQAESLSITHSTLAGNSSERGAGIYNERGSIAIAATLFGNALHGDNCGGERVDDRAGNQADDATCGSDFAALTGLDPALEDHGGPTLTHALVPGSSALGALRLCRTALDQSGLRRADLRCDAGALEMTAFPVIEVFEDGFESGSTEAWSRTAQGLPEKNRLTVAPEAGLRGSSRGLNVDLVGDPHGDNRTYVVSHEPFEERQIHLEFSLGLIGLNEMRDSDVVEVLAVERNKNWLPGALRVAVRRRSARQYDLLFLLRERVGFREVFGGTIEAGGARRSVEARVALTWTAAERFIGGTFRAFVDSRPVAVVDDLDNGDSRVGRVRFGLTEGASPTVRGSIALDEFVSIR